ncbi:MAG TPA: DUF6600 domain-containing protein [Vicinamibacterales bacterium]|nr:DUF6600 domain-containing protein [Vicinamibacterales bacterium]
MPAHIAALQGTVTLERDNQAAPAELNAVLLAGDRLRTAQGRVDVLFADGSALDLDEFSSVDLLSDTLVRLREGRVRLMIARLANDIDYRIDGAGSSAVIHSAGDFRVEIHNARGSMPEIDLAVLRGTAEVQNTHGQTVVRAGLHATALADREPSIATSYNASTSDDFDQWVDDQRAARTGTESPQYLPPDMRAYSGVLDANGSWGNEPYYGNVWYPYVGAGWQPYYDGHWSFVGGFGWCWIGASAWAWPTHHYGRWGMSAGGRWFWMPGHAWAPAWVSWNTGPDFVSWCPLGVDNRPVAAFHGGRLPDVGHGWTHAPAQNFKARAAPRVTSASTSRATVATPLRSPTVTRPMAMPVAAPSPTRAASPRASVVLTSPGGAIQRGVGEIDRGPAIATPASRPRPATGAAPTPWAFGSGERATAPTPLSRMGGAVARPDRAPVASAPPVSALQRGSSPSPPASAPSRVSGAGIPYRSPSSSPPAVSRPAAPSSPAGRSSGTPTSSRGGGPGRGRGSGQ